MFGDSLQAHSKQKEGTRHSDRDAQFAYLYASAHCLVKAGEPASRVDTRKKELVGEYPNVGKE
jgi:hypothetical protein